MTLRLSRKLRRRLKRWALRSLIAILRLLPPRWSSALGGMVAARYGQRFLAVHKMHDNLRTAFPQMSEDEIAAHVRSIIRNFGQVVGELPHLASLRHSRRGTRLEIDDAAIAPVLAEGPVIFVGAHLGNWEAGPVAFSTMARPVVNIYSNLGDAAIDAMLLAARARAASGLTERNRAIRVALAAMGQGSNVALLVDHRVSHGHLVPFFGEPAVSSHFPARLAIRFSRPVVPVWGERFGPVRYRVRFGTALWPDPARSGEDQEIDLTTRINLALEAIIRRSPGEWFCNKNRWPHLLKVRQP